MNTVKVAGVAVDTEGNFQRIFEVVKDTFQYDNQPMGYYELSLSGLGLNVEPIVINTSAFTEEELKLLNILAEYHKSYKGIIKLENGEYLLLSDLEACKLAKITALGLVDLGVTKYPDCYEYDEAESHEDVAYIIAVKSVGF